MRDQHKPKEQLVNELANLRKQVDDLKAAAALRRRVEDALRQSEAQLRSLLDSTPTGIARLGVGGALLLANSALARLLGYATPAEALALTRVLGLFLTRDEERRVLERMAAENGPSEVEAPWRRKDGSAIVVRVVGQAVRGKGGELEGYDLFLLERGGVLAARR
jgi:PAS domain S-box-containing protein